MVESPVCPIWLKPDLNKARVVSWNYSSQINQRAPHRHTRESGYPEVFDFPGFRVALAIASLPGMTPKLFNGFPEHHNSVGAQKLI
jgi:hypothetical protein